MIEPNGENPKQPIPKEVTEILQRAAAEAVIKEITDAHTETNNDKKQLDSEKSKSVIRMNESLPVEVAKDGQTMKRIKNVVTVVKHTIQLIQGGSEIKAEDNILAGVSGLPKNILVELCKNLDLGEINEKNALYLNEIIYRSLNGQLETVDSLVSLFKDVENLRYLDYNIYRSVSSIFTAQAHEMRATENQLEKLTTEDIKKEEKANLTETLRYKEYKTIKDDWVNGSKNMRETIDQQININNIVNSGLAKERIKIKDLTPNQKDYQENLKKVNQDLLSEVKLKLTHDLATISGSSSDKLKLPEKATIDQITRARIDSESISPDTTVQDINANYNRFIAGLDEYKSQGVISPGLYDYLRTESQKYVENAKNMLRYGDQIRSEGRSLWDIAVGYMPGTWEEDQAKILLSLGSKEKFKAYIKTEYNNFEDKDSKNWKLFSSRIRGLYDAIFSAAASNPKDFWQVSFNELTEGMVYKRLNSFLLSLGENLNEDTTFGKNNGIKVKVSEVYAMTEDQTFQGSYLSGGATLSQVRERKVTVGDAITILEHQMVDYKDLRELSHDINALTELGGGIEKLAEISSRVRMGDLGRMMTLMPGLSTAINYYCENLHKVTALNNRTFPTDFGLRDGIYNLDPTGWATFRQLRSTRSIKRIADTFGWKDKDYHQLVQMAQGYAKIVGTFFGSGLNSRLPQDIRWIKDNKDEAGRMKGILEHNLKSLSDPGIEKTMASIDIGLNWSRFNNPRLFQEILYVWAPRIVKGWKPERADKLLNHTDVYHWYEVGEDAFANGQKNDLIDFQKKHIFLIDDLHTDSIDMGLREGWRHFYYRAFLVYNKDKNGKFEIDPATGKKKLDFAKTLVRLRGLGPQIVKIFIKDIFDETADKKKSDISDITIENLCAGTFKDFDKDFEAEITGLFDGKKLGQIEWADSSKTAFRKGFKLSEDQKKALKTFYYKKYIFDHIRDTRPSHFIVMENRTWIPEDEVRGTPDGKIKGYTFHDRLLEYLCDVYKDVYQDKAWIKTYLLPMYVDALIVTEKNVWDEYLEDWKENESKYSFDLNNDPFNYKFTEEDFDKYQDELVSFYKENKNYIGESQIGGQKISFSDDEFFKHLKGFYRTLDKVIKMERWDHNMVKNKLGVWRHTGDKVTLQDRYADMLNGGQGHIDSYLTFNMLNLDEFHFETSGSRGPERMFGETALDVEKMEPNLQKIFNQSLSQFVRHPINNYEEFEKRVTALFSKEFNEAYEAIAFTDQTLAWDYMSRMIYRVFVAATKDKIFRVGAVGPFMEGALRRWNEYQASYASDKVKITLEEGGFSMDSAQAKKFFEIVGNAIGMARTIEQVKKIEPAKLFGKELKGNWAKLFPGRVTNKTLGERETSIDDIAKAADVTIGPNLLEASPMIPLIILAIIAMLAKLAFDKENKKSQ